MFASALRRPVFYSLDKPLVLLRLSFRWWFTTVLLPCGSGASVRAPRFAAVCRLMAAGGGVQARVAWLLGGGGGGGGGGRPVLRPGRALVLADRVANRRSRLGEATCITEMSVMMACWKQNDFSEVACAKEIQAFCDCAAKAEAERRAKANVDGVTQTGFLTPKQATKLLQRYPNKIHNT